VGGSRHDGAELVAALGLLSVVSGVALWWETILPTTAVVHALLYELVVHVLIGAVVLVLDVHIERSELAPHERFRVMLRCFSGFLFLVGLAVRSGISALLAGRSPRGSSARWWWCSAAWAVPSASSAA
jgi:hypothetical protein